MVKKSVFIQYCIVGYRCLCLLQLRKDKRKDIFKRAERYVKEYRQKERDVIRLKREAKKSKNYYIPDEPRLAFVIRIKG